MKHEILLQKIFVTTEHKKIQIYNTLKNYNK